MQKRAYMEKMILFFDLGMAVIFLAIGLLFYSSKGKAAGYLTGYQAGEDLELQTKKDEIICRIYGKRMMLWALPFVLGAVIDSQMPGYGITFAWIVWIGAFVWHMVDRVKREKQP